MADIDVLAAKLDAVTEELKGLRADMKPLLDTVARHDERINSLTTWRNGLTVGLSGLAFGFLKTFFKI